jgi:hypothetical protein
MAEPAFVGLLLKGEHWTNCTAGMPTFDEALELVETHLKQEPKNAGYKTGEPDEYRVYKSDDEGDHPPSASVGRVGVSILQLLEAHLLTCDLALTGHIDQLIAIKWGGFRSCTHVPS